METLSSLHATGMLSLHYGDILVLLPNRNALTSLWRHFGPSSLQECSHYNTETHWFPFPIGMLSLHYGDILVPTGMFSLHYEDTSIPTPYMYALTSLWRHFNPTLPNECSHFTLETLWSLHATGTLFLHYGDTLVPPPSMNALTSLW
jgi:hypothetical protein